MINSDALISGKIDWLSITVPEVKYDKSWSTERKEMRRGLHGYDTGVKYIDGRIELCSSTRNDMLPHIIFSGSCIDRLCLDSGQDTMSILRSMSSGRPSRLDIAIDIENSSLPIPEMRDHFDNGQAVTKATKGVYMETVGESGETLYIGSSHSLRRLRIYDKAAERGIKDKEWTRVELQLRNSAAAQSFVMLVGAEKPYEMIAQIIVDFVDFPEILDWVIALGTKGIKPLVIAPSASDRYTWLMDTALKSLANEMIESHRGLELLEYFRDRVAAEYMRKLSEYKQE